VNAAHYRKMRKDFLQLARQAGKSMHGQAKGMGGRSVAVGYRQAYRAAADRMAILYPLILDGLNVYDQTSVQRRNKLRAEVKAEIERVTG
jgi:hypothetical protein